MSLFLALEAFRIQKISRVRAVRLLFVFYLTVLCLLALYPIGTPDFSELINYTMGKATSSTGPLSNLNFAEYFTTGRILHLLSLFAVWILGCLVSWTYTLLFVKSYVADVRAYGAEAVEIGEVGQRQSPAQIGRSVFFYTLLLLVFSLLGLVSLLFPTLLFFLFTYYTIPYLAMGNSTLREAMGKARHSIRGHMLFVLLSNLMLLLLGFFYDVMIVDWVNNSVWMKLSSAFISTFVRLAQGRLMGLLFTGFCLQIKGMQGDNGEPVNPVDLFRRLQNDFTRSKGEKK